MTNGDRIEILATGEIYTYAGKRGLKHKLYGKERLYKRSELRIVQTRTQYLKSLKDAKAGAYNMALLRSVSYMKQFES